MYGFYAPGAPHFEDGNTHAGSASTCCPVVNSLAPSSGPILLAVASADAEGLTVLPYLDIGVDHLLPPAGHHHLGTPPAFLSAIYLIGSYWLGSHHCHQIIQCGTRVAQVGSGNSISASKGGFIYKFYHMTQLTELFTKTINGYISTTYHNSTCDKSTLSYILPLNGHTTDIIIGW